jgi:hypothetical protein
MSSAKKGHTKYQADDMQSQGGVRGLGAPVGAVRVSERAMQKFKIA